MRALSLLRWTSTNTLRGPDSLFRPITSQASTPSVSVQTSITAHRYNHSCHAIVINGGLPFVFLHIIDNLFRRLSDCITSSFYLKGAAVTEAYM